MAEIDPENLNIALNRYLKQITLSHKGLPADAHNQTIANGMKSMLYDLELLDDDSNHVIVEEARKKAEKGKGRCK
ncbi:MAG: hypothetical protein PHD60_11770 [Clostridia bacterium]|nr:hypothetical protein [Clostridia bacterium]